MTNPRSGDHSQEPIRVVQGAIDAFNRGDAKALIPRAGDGADTDSCDTVRPRPDRGLPEATVFALEGGTISVRHISCLDARRVFCELIMPDGTDLVGIYAVDDERISDARHYFSDIDMLVTVGILEDRHLEIVAVARDSH